jgi:hypothetical protein
MIPTARFAKFSVHDQRALAVLTGRAACTTTRRAAAIRSLEEQVDKLLADANQVGGALPLMLSLACVVGVERLKATWSMQEARLCA